MNNHHLKKRLLLLPCILLFNGCSLTTYLKPTTENIPYNPQTQARLHFSGPQIHFRMARNTTCFDSKAVNSWKNWIPLIPKAEAYIGKEVVADYNDSAFKRIPSTSIGMPDFSSDGKPQLPFKEVVINANEPLIISSWYSFGDANNNTSCSPSDFYFIPQAGADYETSLDLSEFLGRVRSCAPRLNRIVRNADSSIHLIPVNRTIVRACQ